METSNQTHFGRGKNKRFWRKEEEEALIDALLEISVDPAWKGEGGFKNGYMFRLENMLLQKFPDCGLKAMPHIDSKIKWFKDKHAVINEMLYKTHDFKWDDEKKIITCEKQIYEDFCKKHPKAAGLWNTPFPFLEKLDRLFGFDRANGVRCELPNESINMMENEINMVENEIANRGDDEINGSLVKDNVSMSSHQELSPPLPCKKRKKYKTVVGKRKTIHTSIPEVADLTFVNNLHSEFSGYMKDMNTHIATIANAMSTTQKLEQTMILREQEILERKKNLVNDVSIIPGLTRSQVIKVTRLLSSNPNDLDIFYSSPTLEWKKDFVYDLLGLGGSPSS